MINQSDNEDDSPKVEPTQSKPTPGYNNNVDFLDSEVSTESYKPPKGDEKILKG
ncbi:hypothetical protein AB7X32_21470 [Morganella morganii]|uniref:hypothetical protein n=1 Tax=Morganella morganii TaxID=582 RepID=UPI0034E41421